MSKSKKPTETSIGAGWHDKILADPNIVGSDWRAKLTPEEEKAMQAEADWALQATLKDLPGPKRFRVHVTKSRRKVEH